MGSPQMLCSAVPFHARAQSTTKVLGALPPNPQDLSLYGKGSVCYNPLAAEEDRAPVGIDPFGSAQGRPERLSGGRAAGDDSPKVVVPFVF